ncbi:MAG TPA: MmcQ/YjbR family DNA-binding protein [Nocardioidaceae bacterium]|nr:MmcQ/YjbR family DNA-binding protein [Nocardioidaceae bacterium]
MTRDELIEAALAHAGAVEDYPFGESILTVKVGGKVFAWIPLTPSGWLGSGCRVAVKVSPSTALELRAAYPEQVYGASPLSEKTWIALRIGGKIDDDEVRDLIASSYAAVVSALPKRRRPTSSG